MTEPAKSSFVYVTYIRTTPEKLWAALTTPEFMKKYWFGMNIETEWNAGSAWKLVFPDGRVADTGEIIEIEKPKRLILTHMGNDMLARRAEVPFETADDGKIVEL